MRRAVLRAWQLRPPVGSDHLDEVGLMGVIVPIGPLRPSRFEVANAKASKSSLQWLGLIIEIRRAAIAPVKANTSRGAGCRSSRSPPSPSSSGKVNAVRDRAEFQSANSANAHRRRRWRPGRDLRLPVVVRRRCNGRWNLKSALLFLAPAKAWSRAAGAASAGNGWVAEWFGDQHAR